MNEESKTKKRMARRMRPARHPAAQTAPEEPQGLKEEIAVLRGLNRRVSAQVDEVDLDEDLISLVEAVGKSYTRLATLLKTDRMLVGDEGNEMVDALNQALTEMTKKIEKENRRS